MIGEATQSDTLKALVSQHAIREPLRIWASLSAVAKYADAVGLRGFVVEL
jgi:hypothetical protein